MVPASHFNTILRNISRTITLNDEEVEFFRSVLIHRRIKKRQYVLQAGDVCRYETYVVSGCLRGYHVDREGSEHTTFLAVADWWIADLESFTRRTPATMTIEALEDTDLLQIEYSTYESLCLRVPKFERLFRLLLQNAFVSHQRRILAIISQTAVERYKEFLQRYPQFTRRVPQKYIASYLGVTPEFLSRIRRDLSAGKSIR